MKIAVAQIEVVAGRPDINVEKILSEIEKARQKGNQIIIFPEMAVPGYLLGDEWENTAFAMDCFNYNDTIKNATQNIVAVWGNIDIDTQNRNEDGRIRKYNAAFIARNKEYVELGRVHKTLMPQYREFDDERHFYSFRKEAEDKGIPLSLLLKPFEIDFNGTKRKIGIILCEDMWSDDYSIKPIDILLKNGSEVIINLSCSPWTWRKNSKRHSVVRKHIEKHPVYFVYANNVGIQNNGKTIFLFDGHSTIYNTDGSLQKVANDYCQETIQATLFSNDYRVESETNLNQEQDKQELLTGLIYGIRKFFSKLPSKKVVLGLSGGIDSALSAALLTEALGGENIFAVNMPSQFNSNTTKIAARRLSENLGIHYTSISIQNSFTNTIKELEAAVFERLDGSKEKFQIQLSNLNRENIQARDRGSRILAGVASALNAVSVNNGNKTETAFGYATLYGDVNGALAPIADLYKTEVYNLARYINKIKGKEIIPSIIFEIPASAELSNDQNIDEGKGDPLFYPYHDKLVRAFVEFRLDPQDILNYYAEGTLPKIIHCEPSLINNYFKNTEAFIADLEHKWRLYKNSYFKRIQAPPLLAVSKRAFGFDLREAQNGAHFTQAYLKLKKKLLDKQ